MAVKSRHRWPEKRLSSVAGWGTCLTLNSKIVAKEPASTFQESQGRPKSRGCQEGPPAVTSFLARRGAASDKAQDKIWGQTSSKLALANRPVGHADRGELQQSAGRMNSGRFPKDLK